MTFTLNIIKRHLILSLYQYSFCNKHTNFNIVCCNSKIKVFSDHLVKWSLGPVVNAVHWIRHLWECGSSTMLPGLQMAFSYPDAEAVYFVTDGDISDDGFDIEQQLVQNMGRRKLYIILLLSNNVPDEEIVVKFYQFLKFPRVYLCIMVVEDHGNIVRVSTLYDSKQCGKFLPKTKLRDTSTDTKNDKSNRVLKLPSHIINPNNYESVQPLTRDPLKDPLFVQPQTVLDTNANAISPFYHAINHWYWPGYTGLSQPWWEGPPVNMFFSPFDAWKEQNRFKSLITDYPEVNYEPKEYWFAPDLIMGSRVLVNISGKMHYNLAVVRTPIVPNSEKLKGGEIAVQLCKGLDDIYLDRSNIGLTVVSLSSTISYDDAILQPIKEGDWVLAPKDTESGRHDIAQVITGREYRTGQRPPPEITEHKPLTVQWSFLEGESMLPPRTAVRVFPEWIAHIMSLKDNLDKPSHTFKQSKDKGCHIPLIGINTKISSTNQNHFSFVNQKRSNTPNNQAIDNMVNQVLLKRQISTKLKEPMPWQLGVPRRSKWSNFEIPDDHSDVASRTKEKSQISNEDDVSVILSNSEISSQKDKSVDVRINSNNDVQAYSDEYLNRVLDTVKTCNARYYSNPETLAQKKKLGVVPLNSTNGAQSYPDAYVNLVLDTVKKYKHPYETNSDCSSSYTGGLSVFTSSASECDLTTSPTLQPLGNPTTAQTNQLKNKVIRRRNSPVHNTSVLKFVEMPDYNIDNIKNWSNTKLLNE